jgi:hypothetical protein
MAKRPSSRKKSAKSTPTKKKAKAQAVDADARDYTHPEATSPLRPDVGVQAQFRKKKPPRTYRYDSSLSPALEWDEQPAREQGKALLARILDAGSLEEAKAAAEQLSPIPQLGREGRAPGVRRPDAAARVYEYLRHAGSPAVTETIVPSGVEGPITPLLGDRFSRAASRRPVPSDALSWRAGIAVLDLQG